MIANGIIQNISNHQVMALAPAEMRDSYFEEVLESIRTQATNKRLKSKLENEELRL